MPKALAGVRVLDLTNVLAGPFCCHQLAHMGADVIKVEVPERGDLARNLGADSQLNAQGMGVSFLAQNAGKKSVTLNLKHPKGRELALKLVASADVLVENFRPGVMNRLGLGYEALKAVRPELIYCAISGFGQEGPWASRPAYDQIVQGISGAMSITGSENSAPLRVGYPVADTAGGLTAAFAIAASLNAKPRGSFIDVSMLDSLLSTMGWAVSNFLIAGVEPKPIGNENATSAPSGVFRTGDGLLNIAANRDEQWHSLATLLQRDDLLAHPDFATREGRKHHRDRLREELEVSLRRKPAAVWEAELNALGVPAGAILSVPSVLASDQIAERELIASFDSQHSDGRPISSLRTGARIDGEPTRVDRPPPSLGEHNNEVFEALGYSANDLDELRSDGVI